MVLFIFRGKYATVCKAVHKATNKSYAAKFLKKRRRNQDQTKEIIHEIAVLMQCDNANRVIHLYEVYESPTDMVLVLELAAGGELQHILDGGQCLGEVSTNSGNRLLFSFVVLCIEKISSITSFSIQDLSLFYNAAF